jgi:hypothetical protein
MDVKSFAGVAIDALCRGELVLDGVRVNVIPPAGEVLVGLDRSAAPELRVVVIEPSIVASFCPAAPGWILLEQIARGREVAFGTYTLRFHVENPFPRVIPEPGERREADALELVWNQNFRPSIDYFPLPDRLDPQIHSIRVMRKGAIIRGGIWQKTMEW